MDYELHITPEMLDEYMQQRADTMAESSLASYRRKLTMLYEALPEDKMIRIGTLDAVAKKLEEKGYVANTINMLLAAADGLVLYYNLPGLLSSGRYEINETNSPELTRAEYLRLLSAAKNQGNAKAYYLVKAFGLLGVNTLELGSVTVEAAQEGYFSYGNNRMKIPPGFAKELLAYARRVGIQSGSIINGESGAPIGRPSANKMMGSLAGDARVAPEKCNPRALRKMYQTTQSEIQERYQVLIDKEFDELIENENVITGWDLDEKVVPEVKPKRRPRKKEPVEV